MKQERLGQFGLGFTASLVASMVWQFILVIATPIGIAALSSGLLAFPWATVIVTCGWVITAVVASKARFKRTLEIMALGISMDRAFAKLARASPKRVRRANFQIIVNELLAGVCSLLAYHLSLSEKGATFLVFKDGDVDSPLELFAQFGHGDEAMPAELGRTPTVSNSLAGQALKQRKVVAIDDVLKSPSDTTWLPTRQGAGFRSHAAVPVRAMVNGEMKDIGVLCFSVRRPWHLNREDMQILVAFAVKLSTLWAIY